MAKIKVRRSASQRGGLDRGGSFRQPGQPGGLERRSTQQLLETIQHLQEESSDDVAAELSQSKHSMAMVQFIVYWVFLMFVFAAVFAPPYTTHFYRQTATVDRRRRGRVLRRGSSARARSGKSMRALREMIARPELGRNERTAAAAGASGTVARRSRSRCSRTRSTPTSSSRTP